MFSLGLLYLIDSLIMSSSFYLFIIAGMTSVVVNNLIDSLGHEIRGTYISRTPRTHTIPRSVGWGLLISIPIAVAFYFLSLNSYLPFSITFIIITVIDGVVAGLSHMLLDVFTQKGIYVKKNGKWRRFALAHYPYDDPTVNGLAIFLGILMLFLAVYIHGYSYYHL
jgi:hypothetical protein